MNRSQEFDGGERRFVPVSQEYTGRFSAAFGIVFHDRSLTLGSGGTVKIVVGELGNKKQVEETMRKLRAGNDWRVKRASVEFIDGDQPYASPADIYTAVDNMEIQIHGPGDEKRSLEIVLDPLRPEQHLHVYASPDNMEVGNPEL